MPDKHYPRPWRIVAEEATKETDPARMMELVKELNQSLDERETSKPAAQKKSA